MSETGGFTQILSLVSFGISIFLTFLLFVSPREKSASRILSFILACYSVIYLIRYGLSIQSELAIYFPFISIPMIFVYGPFIFFYTRASLFQKEIHKTEFLKISLLPVIGFIIYSLLFTYFPKFRDSGQVFLQSGVVGIFTGWLMFLGIIYTFSFLYLSRKLILKYEFEFEENYSSDAKTRLSWLKRFLVFNFLMVLVYSVILFLRVLGLWKLPLSPFEGIINILLMYQILYYLIRKPVIFHLEVNLELPLATKHQRKDEILPEAEEIKETEEESSSSKITTKYLKQNLTETERKSYLLRIQKYMREEKPYLDDELSLNELAGRLKIPGHHFSMVINIELGKNFFHFISSYRVEEAKRLLSDLKSEDITILKIAFESGFQSKAAFNKAFKEETGFTPTEYRNKF